MRARLSALLCLMLLGAGALHAAESLGTLLGRAREARDAGEWQAAVAAYDGMLKQVSTHETAMLERAQTLSWAGRYAESLEGYRAFRTQYPARAYDADLRIAQVQAWSDQIDDALQTLAPWTEEGQPQAVLDDATYRAWGGRLASSIARLEAWLETRPDDRQARLHLARFRGWTGDSATAEADYRAVLQRVPGDCEAQLGLSRMALWRSAIDAASERLDATDADCRHSPEARLLGAQLDAAQGRVGASLITLKELAQGGPAQRDAKDLLFDDVSARGLWLELRQQRTDTNEGLRVERPWLRLRMPWLSGFAQVEASQREASFNGRLRESDLLGIGLRQPLGEQLKLSAGLQHDSDFGGKSATAWNAGLGWRFTPEWNGQLDLARQLLDFTPAAIDQRGTMRTLDGALSYAPQSSHYQFDLGAGKAWLSAGSQRESFFLSAERRIPLASVDLRVGAQARGFGYSETLALGFFNPERYRYLGLNSSATWRRARRYEFRLDLRAGRQRVNDDDSQFTWGYGIGAERLLGDGRWALFAEWNAGRAGLPVAAAGDPDDYREHTAQIGLRWYGRR